MSSQTAKLFRNGRSQAVRLPAEYRFEGSEVYIRRDPSTGDVVLSRRPDSWKDFFDPPQKLFHDQLQTGRFRTPRDTEQQLRFRNR